MTAAFWRKFDDLFKEMNDFFEKMDDLFAEAKSVHEKVYVENPDEHKVRFRAVNWRERLRLTWKFLMLTLNMIFRGKSVIVFRRRNSIK